MMISKLTLPTLLAALIMAQYLFLSTNARSETEEAALPNYAAGVKEVETKLFTGKDALKIEEKDMAVMTKAGADLAAQMPNPGLKIGAKAPDFSLLNAEGKTVKLSNLLKKGPVILTFYRGAWCPYCNLQMQQLKASLPTFKKYKATLVAVTPQTPDKSLGQFKQDGFPFDVLSDLDYAVIKSYNLYWEISEELDATYKHAFGLDIASFNGAGRRGLPIPGTLVIDKKGIVRASFTVTDYTKRMEPADILVALKEISHKK
jgi:peroxiredoxin